MIVRYERPFSYAAHWARRIARIAFIVFLLSLLSHRFGPLTTPHFLALALIAGGLALLGVVLATIGLTRLWQVAAIGGTASVSALFYAAVPLGFLGYGAVQYLTRPALYEVSTDTLTPPPWIRTPATAESWLGRKRAVTREDREAQVEAYPGLTGRRYEGALDRVFQGVRKVVEQTRIATTAEFGADNARADLEDLAVRRAGGEANAGPNVIPVPTARPTQLVDDGIPGRRSSDVVLQGEWRSLVVGFRFDVLIRLREEAETTFVDLRVASRYGRHDLGMGAMFAEEFLRDLDAELLGIAGD
ncbi:membrane protein [Sinorhizobium meliloti CCBAU 01290]|nr:membrane protein [Sinorhizobium meliloti CCBAU 01290]